MTITAATIVIGVHLFSLHTAPGLEAANPGLYVRHESGDTAGVFRNSYARTSAYAGYTLETADRRFALTLGAVTGYPAKPVLPLAVPSVRFGLSGLGVADQVAARVAYLPKPPGRIGRSHALHLSIEKEF